MAGMEIENQHSEHDFQSTHNWPRGWREQRESRLEVVDVAQGRGGWQQSGPLPAGRQLQRGQFLEDIHLSFGPVLPKWPEGTLDILQCGKSA